jgi:hypothetical protein
MSELKRRIGDTPDPTPDNPPLPDPDLLDRLADRPTPPPPTEQPAVEEERPEGSWEAAGRYLTPELNALADRELAARREAEPTITAMMKRLESQLEYGELAGLDNALKSEDRFKEKLAVQIARRPELPADRLAAEIHDGIRYTIVFDDERYAAGVSAACGRLEREGYELLVRAPRWGDELYRGVNSRWADPAGQVFEVQFHTPASLAAKERTHEAYEQRLDPRVPDAEKQRLAALEGEINAAVPVPPGALEISPYEKGM